MSPPSPRPEKTYLPVLFREPSLDSREVIGLDFLNFFIKV